ncbi:MAG: hypothetical protein MRERV_14c015 [Mycoplasmataceae bacterium RV_VA103A]|nr:MAG: hypothetical protein MRERV_14c015 [Mycoplasmataceae bacterium RV_VA103A]
MFLYITLPLASWSLNGYFIYNIILSNELIIVFMYSS